MSFFWDKIKMLLDWSQQWLKNLASVHGIYVCFLIVEWKIFGKLRQAVMDEFWQGAINHKWKNWNTKNWNTMENEILKVKMLTWQ